MNSAAGLAFTAREIAEALGTSRRRIRNRAAGESWPYTEKPGRGGPCRHYRLGDLPAEVGATVARAEAAKAAPDPEQARGASLEYDPRGLWEWWKTRTDRQRETGLFRAGVILEAEALAGDEGLPLRKAFRAVARKTDGVTLRRIHGWYYGDKGKPGAHLYAPEDRPAALTPGHVGRTRRTGIPPQAWDFFCAHWLDLSRPSISASYYARAGRPRRTTGASCRP